MPMIETLIQIAIALIAGITAFITFRTLKEIKAQRETTYQPEIIIDEKIFYVFSKETGKGNYPSIFSYEKDNVSKIDRNSLNLHLYNIGLGTAKEIKIEFSFDMETSITQIFEISKMIPEDKTIKIKLNTNTLSFESSKNAPHLHSTHIYSRQMNSKINYILPVNISSNPTNLTLPLFVLELYSCLLYSLIHCERKERTFNVPKFPPITVIINYLDIGNKEFVKKYNLFIDLFSFSKEKTYCHMEIKQI